MTRTIKISGYSDDIVSIDGDPELADEAGGGDAPTFVELSTGDVFRVEYQRGGVWRIAHHVVTGKLDVAITKIDPVGDDDEPDPYTEVATITGEIAWVEGWHAWPAPIEEKREKVIDHVTGCDLEDDLVEALWRLLCRGES